MDSVGQAPRQCSAQSAVFASWSLEPQLQGWMTWPLGLELPEGSFAHLGWDYVNIRSAHISLSLPVSWLPHSRVAWGLLDVLHGGSGLRPSFSELGRSCIAFYDPDSKVIQQVSLLLCSTSQHIPEPTKIQGEGPSNPHVSMREMLKNWGGGAHFLKSF